MGIDYGAMLLVLTLVLGSIWAIDRFFFEARRRRDGGEGSAPPDPWLVDWSKSLFPVLLLVLTVRTAVAEPYHIPSGSMIPTLEIGDFIFVDKFAYGVRLPLFDVEVLDGGEPARGDVVVFRPPWAPEERWIKRVVGLPGDRIVIRGDRIWINGRPVATRPAGPYSGDRGDGAKVLIEHLGNVDHAILDLGIDSGAPDVPNAYNPPVVPDGCYFMMGDSRDNSEDSRYHGCVPESALVGKALFVWMSWPSLGRIGTVVR
ncbi:MAG TPA: signal peptidase I [Gammaproteobacteria bacterium]